MATFISVHKNLNFDGMQFVNGVYNTDNEKEISVLSSHPAARRHGVARIDNLDEVPSAATSKKIISKKK